MTGKPDLRIERATERDVPLILHLINGLAEYEKLAHDVTATEAGLVPTAASGTAGDVKPPLPFPNRIETLFEPKLAAAKSCIPSPLKSPTATD